MLELLTFPPSFNEPSGSPFCTKAMIMLHVSKLDWKPTVMVNPSKLPQGKMPVLIDDDVQIPDSENIKNHLEKTYDIDFDQNLSDQEKAQSHSIIRLTEEHLYYTLVNERWANEKNWGVTRTVFFKGLKFPLSKFVPKLVRKKVIQQLNAQGISRHTEAVIKAKAAKDIGAISSILDNKSYLFGDKPTYADICVLPILSSLLTLPEDRAVSESIESHPNLVDYIPRAREVLYPKS